MNETSGAIELGDATGSGDAARSGDVVGSGDISADEREMLTSFIRMRDEIESEHERIRCQLEDMKTTRKTTATFKQLMARKLTLASFLETYRKYDLL